MGLSEIVGRIARDAEAESAEILAAGQERAHAVVEAARAEAEAHRARALDEARRRAERVREHLMAGARLEGRNTVLAEKRRVLDEVEALGRERIRALSDEAFVALFAGVLARRACGDEEVAVDALDAGRPVGRLVEAANAHLVEEGKPGGLRLAKETPDLGGSGMVLRGEGTQEVITPATLVAEARHEIEPELARSLFGGSGEASDSTVVPPRPRAKRRKRS